jgi:hypothetical protein
MRWFVPVPVLTAWLAACGASHPESRSPLPQSADLPSTTAIGGVGFMVEIETRGGARGICVRYAGDGAGYTQRRAPRRYRRIHAV